MKDGSCTGATGLSGKELARFRVLKEGGLTYRAMVMNEEEISERRIYLRKALRDYPKWENLPNDELNAICLASAEKGYLLEDKEGHAIGVTVGEILLPEITGNVENVIEFIKNSERATVSFSQERYKSRIEKLAADRPEECQIVAKNTASSLCAHIPVAWIKISPTKRLSEEQRKEIAERFKRK